MRRSPRFSRFVAATLLFGCAGAAVACDERGGSERARKRVTLPPAPKAPTPKPAVAEPRREPGTSDDLRVSELPTEGTPTPSSSAAHKSPQSLLIIDAPQAIGPAGQMTASERGVVMVNRNDDVQVAKRGPLAAGSRSGKAQFSAVRGGPADFFAVARGPLVLREYAYWIKDGKLVRRPLDNGKPLQVLATDARNGTRVAGADVPDAPAHAFYVSNPRDDEAPPRAKLWVEGAESLTISPEGAGASSIAVAGAGRNLFSVAIDARSAMTPMHGRVVRFSGGKPELDSDIVMWVGSTSQTLSEVFVSSTPFGVRAFLPIERDVSHFGLVMLDLGSEPRLDPKTTWRGYPNGLDVAPVASGAFCGSAFVAYTRPETPSPDARQVLEVAEIQSSGLGPAEVVDSALGFANVSLASGTNFATLAYVADSRTIATTLRCTPKR